MLYNEITSNMCRGVGLFKGFPRITLGYMMQTNNTNVFLNVYWFELDYFLGPLSEMGYGFRSQTSKCKKGSDWLKRWVEAQHNIFKL